MPNLTKSAAALRLLAVAAATALMAGCGLGTMAMRAADGGPLPCPSSPNCVSSRATDDSHRVAPLAYTGTATAAQAALVRILASQPRTRIVTAEPGYLHVEFRSRLLRFVDDLQLWVRPRAGEDRGTIDVRSSSRLGYSDFGANRERVEALRRKWQAQPPPDLVRPE